MIQRSSLRPALRSTCAWIGPVLLATSAAAQVDTVDRTGVEMEALHACSIAALTVYDMCKSADRGMVIGDLALWEKTGGRSGTYRRPGDDQVPPDGTA